jgi:hypothetical protein
MLYFKLLFTLLIKDVSNLTGFINHKDKDFNPKKIINKLNIKCCMSDYNKITIDKSTTLSELFNESTKKDNLNNSNYDGYNLAHSKYDNTTIENIRELHHKKKILDKLIDNNICLNDKLKLIEYYDLYSNKYIPDITAGGLFNDWNYIMPDEIL